ncbi:MAG: aminotransferase class V-fold PLP-dependent enzyme [Candidatus Taylorbacteria bacterium]|nr:aminotransferase class V-fold PLP-dependent enzyme [Candidatus Taylorbacteria bacterium]
MQKSRTYFDYASLPPIDKRVLKEVTKYSSTKYANASAWHKEGVNGKNALEDARSRIASFIHGHKDGVVFTSGGTESNNMALFGPVYSELEKGMEYSDLHRRWRRL